MSFLDDYEPVEDRIRAFYEDFKLGRINTKKMDAPEGEYIFRARVYRPESVVPDATGWAHESVAQLPANMKASALEVCETSAIGRALANLGYAPKGKRPSREEMASAAGKDRAEASPSRRQPGTGAAQPENGSGREDAAVGGPVPATPSADPIAPTLPIGDGPPDWQRIANKLTIAWKRTVTMTDAKQAVIQQLRKEDIPVKSPRDINEDLAYHALIGLERIERGSV
jgi:hypothetical protein